MVVRALGFFRWWLPVQAAGGACAGPSDNARRTAGTLMDRPSLTQSCRAAAAQLAWRRRIVPKLAMVVPVTVGCVVSAVAAKRRRRGGIDSPPPPAVSPLPMRAPPITTHAREGNPPHREAPLLSRACACSRPHTTGPASPTTPATPGRRPAPSPLGIRPPAPAQLIGVCACRACAPSCSAPAVQRGALHTAFLQTPPCWL